MKEVVLKLPPRRTSRVYYQVMRNVGSVKQDS